MLIAHVADTISKYTSAVGIILNVLSIQVIVSVNIRLSGIALAYLQ